MRTDLNNRNKNMQTNNKETKQSSTAGLTKALIDKEQEPCNTNALPSDDIETSANAEAKQYRKYAFKYPLNVAGYHQEKPVSLDELYEGSSTQFTLAITLWSHRKNSDLIPLTNMSIYDFGNFICYLAVSSIDSAMSLPVHEFDSRQFYGQQHKRVIKPFFDAAETLFNGVNKIKYLEERQWRECKGLATTQTSSEALDDSDENVRAYLQLLKTDKIGNSWPYNPANDYMHEIERNEKLNLNELVAHYPLKKLLRQINKILKTL